VRGRVDFEFETGDFRPSAKKKFLSFSIEELYTAEDRVAYRYTMRGTHQGEFAGTPATGNKVEISGIGIWRIENGKVVDSREEPDVLGFMQQLGMELKPKEVKK